MAIYWLVKVDLNQDSFNINKVMVYMKRFISLSLSKIYAIVSMYTKVLYFLLFIIEFIQIV